MAILSICLFSLAALCLTGRPGLAFQNPRGEPSTEAPVLYDYSAEKYLGRYTGEWVPNTVTHFDRVQAVIEYNYRSNTERLLNFLDELSDAEIKEIEANPLDVQTFTYLSIQHARDHRMETEQQLLAIGSGSYYYFGVNEASDESAYPKNKEIVWQIDIPQDHIAIVVLAISLEDPTEGGCINDFVAVYTDDRVPSKFCSTLDEIKQFMPDGSDQLTIKFQSNEANNAGHFTGAVWMYHNSILFSQQPSNLVVSIEEDPAAVAEEDMNEELKEYDMDLPEVEQAVTCLVRIAKYGEKAAEQYISSPPNSICTEMSEAFFKTKYATS